MTEEEFVLVQIKTLQPIQSSAIARNSAIPERKVRRIIRELIKEYPIASSVKPPYGYFLAQNRQEVENYAQSLRDRLIEDAKRRRDFIRASHKILHPEQLQMEV